MSNNRNYTRGEEITNAILHGIGLGLAIAALVILLVLGNRHGNVWHIVAYSIYGSSLIMLYLSSTLYHSFPEGKGKNILRIIDHSSIFLLIAGTYTPLTLILLRGNWGWTIFALVWGIALIGILLKIIYINKLKYFSTLLYLIMGWLVILVIKPLLAVINKPGLIFLIIGGLLYTSGIFFYSCEKIKYNHAIWHLFVLGGSICHFFTVLYLLY